MTRGRYIECNVRTSDGGYESKLTIPVDSTAKQRMDFVKLWIEMLKSAMELDSEES